MSLSNTARKDSKAAEESRVKMSEARKLWHAKHKLLKGD
jgi:hypothetical protein